MKLTVTTNGKYGALIVGDFIRGERSKAVGKITKITDIGASVREDILEQGEDTLTFLGNYIDQIDVKIDKQKLKAFAKELYMEAGE